MKRRNSKEPNCPIAGGETSTMGPTRNKQPCTGRLFNIQRQSLPISQVSKQIVDNVRRHQTLILLSETGSGKSTQIPQFLYESKINQGKLIGITQPRRVAAITVAKRVAHEQSSGVGDLVGYSIRFEDVTSIKTQIKFMTDGILFREALSDQLLKQYNVIILDEAHERTIATDVLFGIVKKAQQARRAKKLEPLKIIIMSATMNVDHFHNYFNQCPILLLQGSNFEVKMLHAIDKIDYMEACITTIFQIHETKNDDGDILVFLTGQEEIDGAAALVRKLAKLTSHCELRLVVHPMYAAMSQQKQMDVFQLAPHSTRKVILATNIAETSITIPGIKYVIDCGRAKIRSYDAVTGVDTLKVSWISKAQAWQRAGRAGRIEDGECYRTYTKEEYEAMEANATPEILRCNLLSAMIQLLALGIDARHFDFLDKPRPDAMDRALQELAQLEAIGPLQSPTPALTPLGRKMAKFPLDPKYAKILLSAPDFGCLEEVLSVVALLSGENIFLQTTPTREKRLQAHNKFHSKYGDHITLLNVFNAFMETDKRKTWCYENFLLERHLSHAAAVRQQLKDICHTTSLKLTSSEGDPIPVIKCLLTGLYQNVAELQRDNSYLTLSGRTRAKIHPSSTLNGRARPAFVVFSELVLTTSHYMRTVTEIDPQWIVEAVPNYNLLGRLNRDISDSYSSSK